MSDLPGVGKKMSFLTSEEQMLVLISHHSGKRELHLFDDEDDDEPCFTVKLNAYETKEIGAQLLGAMNQHVDADTMKTFNKHLVMEWSELKDHSFLIGKTLIDSRIREETGASVMAIMRADDMIVSPDPSEVLRAGDTLMAAGKSDQIKEFELYVTRKGN
ncbi:potassium transporter TrkA [Salipaludibacillus neizhouensis]|uniref:Potassium transporter TrkA n=2 Tax=Bacillaceae TaxID=186817 RepID=A0A3A9KFH3_9BACI|nr:potassium transporter TrkA [Salipaludibacillus neizhouensis]